MGRHLVVLLSFSLIQIDSLSGFTSWIMSMGVAHLA